MQPIFFNVIEYIQAKSKKHNIQIDRKFLYFRVEHILTSHDIFK